jgi:spore coat protein U-like protein
MKASTMIKVVSAAALLAGAAAASAATANGTLSVSATVNATCFVDSASALAFSSYDPSQGERTGTSSITVRCTNGTQFDIGLDKGKGAGATEESRVMTSGTNTLAYSLHQDAAHSKVWGNTVGTNTVRDTGIGLGSGTAITKTVHGKIPDQPNAVPGSYTDQVTVTVTY